MAATIPADVAQYFGHVLRITQKIAYLYGWHDFSQFDEMTESLITLFIGIMFGVEGAAKAVVKISNSIAASAAKRIAAQALTKGTLYPIVKRVATLLGVKMTKQVFARGVSKAIPVLGGVLSGGLTLATFKPMALRLQREMKTFKQARADFFTGDFKEEDFITDLTVEDIQLTDISDEETELFAEGNISVDEPDVETTDIPIEFDILEQRLNRIERLKTSGLITDKEYSEQRQKILDSL